MAEQNNSPVAAGAGNCFNEAVCVNTPRVFDSCADRNCLEDLRINFTDMVQPLVDEATSAKVRKCEVINTYIDVEPIPFNKGFYAIDLTFFFRCTVDLCLPSQQSPTSVEGYCSFSKKSVLYGGEGNARVFTSAYQEDDGCEDQYAQVSNNPRAVAQVADPIVLDSELCEWNPCNCNCCCPPRCVCRCFNGNFNGVSGAKAVNLTLGLFCILHLERDVQLLIPAYDYCVPCKSCSEADADDACEIFRKITFPFDDFFPVASETTPGNCGCGNNNNNNNCGCNRQSNNSL